MKNAKILDYRLLKRFIKKTFQYCKKWILQKRMLLLIKSRSLKLLRNCTSLQYYQVQFLTNSPYNCIVAVAQNKFDKLPSLTSNSCLISYQILKIVLYCIFQKLVTPYRVAMQCFLTKPKVLWNCIDYSFSVFILCYFLFLPTLFE